MTKIITATSIALYLALAPHAHAQFMQMPQQPAPFFQSQQQPSFMQPMQQQQPLIQQFSVQPGIGQPTINCTTTNMTSMFSSTVCN